MYVGSEYGIWLHVDAAYAGCSFICEEFRHYLQGIEVSCHKFQRETGFNRIFLCYLINISKLPKLSDPSKELINLIE